MGAIIIPAHDEESVIARCLEAVAEPQAGARPRIVVACNGCSDRTAEIALSSGLADDVLELAEASKNAAINAAESLDLPLPRLYLDADVELTSRAAVETLSVLAHGAVAARPPLRYDTTGASAVVRSYYRARNRAPSLLGRLWGAGIYGLSKEGRSRFGEYPAVTGEDLWVDEHFSGEEIVIIDTDEVMVRVPRTTRALLRTLRRVQRGNTEQRSSTGDTPDRPAKTTAGASLTDVLRGAAEGPAAALDAAVYVLVALAARIAARLDRSGGGWERDETSRVAAPDGSGGGR